MNNNWMAVSIQHQLSQIKKKYKQQIKDIENSRNDSIALSRALAKIVHDDFLDKSMSDKLLPVYYIFNHDYAMAWNLVMYLTMLWKAKNIQNLVNYGERILEKPDDWDLHVFLSRLESTEMPDTLGSGCFRLDNEEYNRKGIEKHYKEELNKPPYDISPEARYKTVDETKNYHLSYDSVFAAARLFEVFFRQGKHEEADECMFRMRYVVGSVEPPKDLLGCPTPRQTSAWVNTHDYWYQARLCPDAKRRIDLAWAALYWCIESGLRTAGTEHRQLYMFENFCQIAAEFRLFGDRHDEFWSHFKRFALHASISFCREMIDYPVELIPFSERGMPGVAEFKRLYDEMYPPKE